MGSGRVSLAPELLLQQWERYARNQRRIRDLRFSNRRFADIGITNLEIGNERVRQQRWQESFVLFVCFCSNSSQRLDRWNLNSVAVLERDDGD